MDADYAIVLFHSTSSAIRMEKLSQKAGLSVKLIPVPRHLSSDCGICLRFRNDDIEKIKEILKIENVEYNEIYKLKSE